MSEIIFSITEAPEGGFVARALGHSIFVESDSMEAIEDAVREAVSCHFDPEEKPVMIRLHFTKEQVIAA